jgi:hypothetical protein
MQLTPFAKQHLNGTVFNNFHLKLCEMWHIAKLCFNLIWGFRKAIGRRVGGSYKVNLRITLFQ